jgi:4-hydroxybenzoate polyprenyltransferase/phosphoserine phosphatase
MTKSVLYSEIPTKGIVTKGLLVGEVPLCVDLDGTLILSDVLWESVIQLWSKPLAALRVTWALRHGKASMKGVLAEAIPIDPTSLPYREDLLTYLHSQYAEGRQIILVTATHHLIAQRVAEFLGIFSAVKASEGHFNLGGINKRDVLIKEYGVGGFDYIGDHNKDLVIFSSARLALLADPSQSLKEKTAKVAKIDKVFEHPRNWFNIIMRALRVHQWAKNSLLGVPLVTAHKVLDFNAWMNLLLAFICFSLLASATYIVNDLHDLQLDRKHQKKRFRALASGDLPIPIGIVLAVLLMVFSFALTSAFLPRFFLMYLIIYAVITMAYSFDLKRRLIADVLILAILYTLRIMAGAAAIDVGVSEWLLMFSFFFFISLALLKRYIELEKISDGNIPGRGYMPCDTEIIMSIGPTSGLLSVLVMAQYINSPAVTKLYQTPQLLWMLCLLLVYWITRIWFLAKRGWVHHDPIVFALMDKRSYVVAGFAAIILMLASLDIQRIFGL